jgi:hypothetical protein
MSTNPEVRMTKQGVRDLNFRGSRKAQPETDEERPKDAKDKKAQNDDSTKGQPR